MTRTSSLESSLTRNSPLYIKSPSLSPFVATLVDYPPMIHTQKLPTFALYAAYADEFGVPVFGITRDEALNNLAEEIRVRVGEEGRELATKGKQP